MNRRGADRRGRTVREVTGNRRCDTLAKTLPPRATGRKRNMPRNQRKRADDQFPVGVRAGVPFSCKNATKKGSLFLNRISSQPPHRVTARRHTAAHDLSPFLTERHCGRWCLVSEVGCCRMYSEEGRREGREAEARDCTEMPPTVTVRRRF